MTLAISPYLHEPRNLRAACSARGLSRVQPPGAHPHLRNRSTDRKYLLERVDDAAVVQLYADGFQSLPLKQKTLI